MQCVSGVDTTQGEIDERLGDCPALTSAPKATELGVSNANANAPPGGSSGSSGSTKGADARARASGGETSETSDTETILGVCVAVLAGLVLICGAALLAASMRAPRMLAFVCLDAWLFYFILLVP